jgi:hypothetical protein
MNRRDFIARVLGGAAAALVVAQIPFDVALDVPQAFIALDTRVIDGILKEHYEDLIRDMMAQENALMAHMRLASQGESFEYTFTDNR